ncbi:carboxypeptidase regulatory-like domain-containing protein [Corallococcus sp. M34]|uniref:carboxypeptidase-like regulatory domain-containing protein n=1 Tax=Citreicoccus inhibens TaxID=2849499 RepID=UPI001C24E24F|nr:carboxypeptidase-like regulatory domain-containing protein [Citreicoccus inhibens]MBU8894546.1 carboxypeptidase regulatory-like domain-containing protein [Citreicoccus inhibens]
MSQPVSPSTSSLSPLRLLAPVTGVALVVLCLSLGCAMGDEGTPKVPGGSPVGGPCSVDQDCGDPALFMCNTAVSRCEASCRVDVDCGASRRGQAALPQCEANPLGCRCDANRCVAALCTADADCKGAGQVCRDGQCGAAPALSLATACHIVPDVVVGRPGTPVRFSVWVMDAAGQPVVPRELPSWVARSERVQGSGQGLSATFVLGTPGVESDAVGVTLGSASCAARVTVLTPKIPTGGVRVRVADELTGRAIPGAVVSVSNGQGGELARAMTDGAGLTWVAATGEVTVSVFHPDFGYLTVAGYDTQGLRDLVLPLRRNPRDTYGGARGVVPDVVFPFAEATPLLAMGLTGLSAPGLPAEVDPVQLLGPARAASASSVLDSLPQGGFVMGSPGEPPEVRAPGVAGVCDASLAGVLFPEEAVRAGACGTRTGWALTGQVPRAEVLGNLLSPAADPLALLIRALPAASRFHSTVVRDVQFRVVPTPGAGTDSPDMSDVSHFARVSYPFQQVPLAFPFVVRFPPLPRVRGAYLDRAFALATVTAPGRGMVPVGMGAALNRAPVDPNTDAQEGLSGPGLVRLRMAPAHHGLEGQPYRLVAMASSDEVLGQGTAGSATSTLLAPLEAPRFDPSGTRPVALGMDFLAPPEGALYNGTLGKTGGLEARELRLGTPVEGATLLRAIFTNRAGQRWTVLMDPRRAAQGVRLPRPPGEFEDRTFWGDLPASAANFALHALVVRGPEGAALGASALAEADGSDLERLPELTQALSTLDYGVTATVMGAGLAVAPSTDLVPVPSTSEAQP